MKGFGRIDDGSKMLKDCDLPSFSTVGIFG